MIASLRFAPEMASRSRGGPPCQARHSAVASSRSWPPLASRTAWVRCCTASRGCMSMPAVRIAAMFMPAATTLLRRGLNAKQAQIWLGHHSPSFTLATYVHFLDDDLPSADFLDG